LKTAKTVPASVHAFLEDRSKYSIVLNLLGIEEKDIGIRVNAQKREIAVMAKRETYASKQGSFWIFGVPSEGLLSAITARFEDGVLEICIPRDTHLLRRALA
jgi:HSP20 family molecular chaperone IbpA